MVQELVYTSAPKGLMPGSNGGFCTIAATAGLSKAWIDRLEPLSGYAPLYPPQDPKAAQNPVAHCHWRFVINARRFSVLSRVAFAGQDYSGRSNMFAHHLVLSSDEYTPGGPALVLTEGPFRREWTGEPAFIEGAPKLPTRNEAALGAPTWARVAGDAGWAGVLAEAALQKQVVYLQFDPGTDVLGLYREALALLPPEERWDVTFSTFFFKLPAGTDCLWRASPASTRVSDAGRAQILDLTKPLGTAPQSEFASAAREGRTVAVTRREAASIVKTAPPIVEAQVSSIAPKKVAPVVKQIDVPSAAPERLPRMEELPDLEMSDSTARRLSMAAVGLAAVGVIVSAFALFGARSGPVGGTPTPQTPARDASAPTRPSASMASATAAEPAREAQRTPESNFLTRMNDLDKRLADLERQRGGATRQASADDEVVASLRREIASLRSDVDMIGKGLQDLKATAETLQQLPAAVSQTATQLDQLTLRLLQLDATVDESDPRVAMLRRSVLEKFKEEVDRELQYKDDTATNLKELGELVNTWIKRGATVLLNQGDYDKADFPGDPFMYPEFHPQESRMKWIFKEGFEAELTLVEEGEKTKKSKVKIAKFDQKGTAHPKDFRKEVFVRVMLPFGTKRMLTIKPKSVQ